MNVNNLLIEQDTAIEETLFTITGRPIAEGRPLIFKGRTMVIYLRNKGSSTGWASIRESSSPHLSARSLSTFVTGAQRILSSTYPGRVYFFAMGITDFELLLKVIPIEQKERSVLRDGYATLLQLGWPTSYINWKMCERACSNLVPAYQGIASWTAYKEAWAAEDIKRR